MHTYIHSKYFIFLSNFLSLLLFLLLLLFEVNKQNILWIAPIVVDYVWFCVGYFCYCEIRYGNIYILTCLHTYIHTYLHTYIHIYIGGFPIMNRKFFVMNVKFFVMKIQYIYILACIHTYTPNISFFSPNFCFYYYFYYHYYLKSTNKIFSWKVVEW